MLRWLLISLPFRACVALLQLMRIRFVPLTHPESIGHLALEPDCFLKEQALGGGSRQYSFIFIAPDRKVANACLLDYWREHIGVIANPRLSGALRPFAEHAALRHEVHSYTIAINETAGYIGVQNAWRGREPLLRLSSDDRKRGRDYLQARGMPSNAWFAGVHCREGGYAPNEIHDFRDADISNYLPAMEEIVRQGGWCVRLGDPSMKPLPRIPGVIDYAHQAERSPSIDVFLCADARFVLGSSSGLYCVATAFGVPSALANLVPVSTLSYGTEDINIPKLHFSEREGRYLTFRELFASPIANFRFSNLYREEGIRIEESSAEDIRELCAEMIERANGAVMYTEGDNLLQRRFKALFRPGHFSYGASARVGRDFLRKYEHLLGD
jgi:putative glycosyltransferase (TIGR04372 family)